MREINQPVDCDEAFSVKQRGVAREARDGRGEGRRGEQGTASRDKIERKKRREEARREKRRIERTSRCDSPSAKC